MTVPSPDLATSRAPTLCSRPSRASLARRPGRKLLRVASAHQREAGGHEEGRRLPSPSRRLVGLAGLAVATGGLGLAPARAAPPPPPRPFCGVTEAMPAWAFGTPWQEDLVKFGKYSIWYRDVNNQSLNGPLSGLQQRYAPDSVGKLPILVVAGGPGLPHNYLDSLELMAAFRRVVLFDSLGTGLSYLASGKTGPPPADISMQLLMDELDAVCSSLRLSGTSSDSGFHIYAHGSGGMVALQYAAQRAPPGLRSLVLASVPDSYQALIDDRRAAAQALGPAPAEVLVNREGDASAKAEFQAALGVYNRAYISRQDPGCLAAARQGRSGAAFEALAGRRLFSAAGQLAGWDCADSAARLGGLPVLVCRGERDEVSAGSAGRLAAALQAGKLATVPGAGSYMHIDAWEPHLETVEGFISAAEGSKTVTAGG